MTCPLKRVRILCIGPGRLARLPDVVPSLGRVSSGDEGRAGIILRVDPGEFLKRVSLEGPSEARLSLYSRRQASILSLAL